MSVAVLLWLRVGLFGEVLDRPMFALGSSTKRVRR